MESDADFEEQLRQEEEEQRKIKSGEIRTEPDGTVMEWDSERKAWFPKIDEDFIAKYNMSYGVETTEESATTTTTTTTTTESSVPSVTDPNYYYWYYQHYYSQSGTASTSTVDSSAGPKPPEIDTDSKEYREWYKWYCSYYQSQQSKDQEKEAETETDKKDDEKKSTTSKEEEQADFDNWAYYNYYYGQQGDQDEQGEKGETEEKSSKDEEGNDKKDGTDDKKAQKRKAEKEPPKWFEMEDEKNTAVYISGLPPDITDDEFRDMVNKCGLVMYDPITRKPKVKLYKDSDGNPKGDGLCSYIKRESVGLALKIIDGYRLRDHVIHVEQAKFELKGDFDPKKRRRKLTNKEKQKVKEQQQKLLDWRPDKPRGVRLKHEKTIVIKNVFDVKEFDDDPTYLPDLRDDMKTECSKYGKVKKVVVCDRNPDGVVTVMFDEAEEADVCKEALNGRWFAKRQLAAETWDGKTKYHKEETEEEKEARLKKWEKFLESSEGRSEDKNTTEKKTVKEEASKEESSSTNDSPSDKLSTEDNSGASS